MTHAYEDTSRWQGPPDDDWEERIREEEAEREAEADFILHMRYDEGITNDRQAGKV